MNSTIRTYKDDDFPAVTALEESGLHEPYRSTVFIRQMGEICPETFLVEVKDEAPLGYTIGTLVQHDPHEAWILRMGVEESHRRNGVGSALLIAVASALQTKNARTIRLSVSPGNLPAVRLYERQGFTEEKTIRAYFGKGEDRRIMKKSITKNAT